MFGWKLIKEYCDGIKLAIKLVDAEAIIIKNKATTVSSKLLYLPIISVGFVKILSISSNFWFKKTSAPETMKTANTENKIIAY